MSAVETPGGESRIVFLDIKRFENGAAVRGAVLVTDTETKPVEFRCTNAVRPTSLQKVLYGGILDQHLLVELTSVPLLRAISSRVSLIVVRDPVLLEVRTKTQMPLVLIQSQAESAAGGSKARIDNALLHSESGKFEPLVLAVKEQYADDATIARPLLELVGKRCSPLEPFDRLQLALEQVHEQKRD